MGIPLECIIIANWSIATWMGDIRHYIYIYIKLYYYKICHLAVVKGPLYTLHMGIIYY